MIYDDTNGAELVPHDDARVSVGRAWAAMVCLGAAFWLAVGGVLWWVL